MTPEIAVETLSLNLCSKKCGHRYMGGTDNCKHCLVLECNKVAIDGLETQRKLNMFIRGKSPNDTITIEELCKKVF